MSCAYVCVLSLVLQLSHKPYRRTEDNTLETINLGFLTATCSVLGIHTLPYSLAVQILVTLIVFIGGAIVMIYGIFISLRVLKLEKQHVLKTLAYKKALARENKIRLAEKIKQMEVTRNEEDKRRLEEEKQKTKEIEKEAKEKWRKFVEDCEYDPLFYHDDYRY